MSAVIPVMIHSSQFPDQVRRDLLDSLRRRQINHKFHYDSLKQSRKWLALHEACSPARTGADVLAIYDQSFTAIASQLGAARVHVVGLGCGGGQKDTRLLGLLQAAGKQLHYTAVDVSVPLVLTARQAALASVPDVNCSALVCDLGTASDLPEVLERWLATPAEENPRTPSPLPKGKRVGEEAEKEQEEEKEDEKQPQVPLTPTPLPEGEGSLPCAEAIQAFSAPGSGGSFRLFTFFGMLPNFEPDVILPRLAALLGPGDQLLLSANLAPGADYAAGVRQILPQYDNELTRDWLLTLLLDLGLEKRDGEIRFTVEDITAKGADLKRVAAYLQFNRRCELWVDQQRFEFAPDESLRLFFSYRHTPELVRALVRQHGLGVGAQWVADSQQEGVFLVGRPSGF